MTDWSDRLTDEERNKLESASQPKSPRPMLAVLTDDRFSDPAWIFERKLDGERALGQRKGRRTRLVSRNGNDLGDRHVELVETLAGQACDDFIVDGEVVAFEGSLTSFERLQRLEATRR
jgi:bifunctional non-homologous end joining protein LigD